MFMFILPHIHVYVYSAYYLLRDCYQLQLHSSYSPFLRLTLFPFHPPLHRQRALACFCFITFSLHPSSSPLYLYLFSSTSTSISTSISMESLGSHSTWRVILPKGQNMPVQPLWFRGHGAERCHQGRQDLAAKVGRTSRDSEGFSERYSG